MCVQQVSGLLESGPIGNPGVGDSVETVLFEKLRVVTVEEMEAAVPGKKVWRR